MEIQKNNCIINYILILTLFLCDVVDDNLMLIIESVLILFLYFRHLKMLPQRVWMLIAILFVHGGLTSLIFSGPFYNVLLQLCGILISVFFYYNCLEHTNLLDVWILYLRFSVLVSVFALLQQVAFGLGITFIYDLSWIGLNNQISGGLLFRSTGFWGEPGKYALILSIAAYIAIYSLFGKTRKEYTYLKKWESFIILIAYVSTFSAGAYICMTASFLLVVIEQPNLLKKIAPVVIGCIFIVLAYLYVPAVTIRFEDTLNLLNGTKSLNEVNASSNIIFNNFNSMLYTFKETIGMGVGIGNYNIAFSNYIKNHSLAYYLFFNQSDGYSLLIRIFTELGIFGVLPVVLLIKIFKRAKCCKQLPCFVNGFMIFMLLRLLLHGHYFNGGLWFVIISIVYIGKKYKNEIDAITG